MFPLYPHSIPCYRLHPNTRLISLCVHLPPSLSLSLSLRPVRYKNFQVMASSSPPANYDQEGVDGHFIPTDENVLQKHVAFFDRNQDGLVYPWETFQGFRAIGASLLLSLGGSILINLTLSQKTRPGKFPSLLFPIEVRNIQRAKHGSDSGVYDSEGRFVPSKFEEMFSKHARSHPNSLTSDELKEMLKANRVPKNFMGWFSSYTEWQALYSLCKDKNGLLHRETIKAVYDGNLFERMEKERSSAKKKT